MDKYTVTIFIGLLCYVASVMISSIVIGTVHKGKPKPEPRTESDGVVLYVPKAMRQYTVSMVYLLSVALIGIGIAMFILKSNAFGTLFVVLGGVMLCLAIIIHILILRNHIRITESEIIEHEIVTRRVKICDIAFYNVSNGRLTMYDKFGVPAFPRVAANLVGFDLLVHTLNERGVVIVERPFPPKHYKTSPQYKAHANKMAGYTAGGICLVIAFLALFIFSLGFGLSLPPENIEPIELTGKIDMLDASNYKVWLEGDDDWFVVNSVDRHALDNSFWKDVRKGDEIALTYYICLDIGTRRDICRLEYDGKIYLELDDVKKLEADERNSMLFAATVVYPVSAAVAVIGAAAMTAASLVYKSKRKKLYAE